MKSIAVTWSLALSLMTGASLAQENPAPPILKVMLQGSSAADMRALVEAQNGTVTHDLPIIDAVGASLTRGQLNEILKSPLVGRHLDDLDFEPPAPDEASPPACEVDGALELEIQSHGLQWRLYNKQDTPAVLAQVTLDWPSQLGAITALTLDGTALPLPKALPDAPTSLSLTLGAKTKAEITDLATLEATFEQADKHSMSQLAQHDFELSLDFQGECSTELIPG